MIPELSSSNSAIVARAIANPQTTKKHLEDFLSRVENAPVDDFVRATLQNIAKARLSVLNAPTSNASATQQNAVYDLTEERPTAFSSAIVQVSKEFSNAKLRFAASPDAFEVAAQYWQKGYGFRAESKTGERPSRALDHFAQSPTAYAMDCLTATSALAWLALKRVLGDSATNQLDSISLGANGLSKAEQIPGVTYGVDGDASTEAESLWVENNLRSGDWVYFSNWEASPEGKARGWKGANALYLGRNAQNERVYFAHPIGIVNEKRLVDIMNQFRVAGSTRPASLSTLVVRLTLSNATR